MFVDLLNSRVTSNIPQAKEVNLYDFWNFYLKSLSIVRDSGVNDTERKLLAFLLSNENTVSWFKKPHVDKMGEVLGSSYNNIRQTLLRLLKKGLLQKTEIRGDYILNKTLLVARDQMMRILEEGDGKMNFIFSLKLKEDG